jgi:hypothetical protein
MRWRQLDWPLWARGTATAAYLAAVTAALLAAPSTFAQVDQLLPHQDKIAHLGLFLAFAPLVRWSLPREGTRLRLGALAALAVYAGAIEVLQPSLTSGQRTFEWADLACNYAGLCAGWALFPWLTAR